VNTAPRVIQLRPAGRAAAGVAVPLPLSLYVHFPWCVRKCPYCDFNSHEACGGIPEEDYVAALIADLEFALPAVWGRRVATVFIGGGTPSLVSPQALARLLDAVRSRLNLLPEAEITLEANPGTVESQRFAGFRAAGANRLSLGIQSLNDRHLAALGRIHDAASARAAIEAAQENFDSINLDLMYALPGQTLDEARRDIETVAAAGVAHVSAYHLTLEPNTPFHHRPPAGIPDPDLAADMQIAVEETLAGRGYQHYETSAFARPGMRCRHNLNYWTFGDYLGIGAGAHGKLSFHDRIVREARHRHPQAYMEAVARGEPIRIQSPITAEDLPMEFMMNALRLNDGFPPQLFAERTGLSPETVRRPLDQAAARGLVEVSPERVRPTELGRRFLNDLLEMFCR
jgi:oxygen-independent coproporphyrinogen-3 oxidase